MKNLSVYLFIALCLITGAVTINAQSQQPVCGTMEVWQQLVERYSSLALKHLQLENEIYRYVKNLDGSRSTDNDSIRIIPVVFHVLHEGGVENISDAQIFSCLDVLNKDYRRHNADTVNTPAAFKLVAADAKIEFRLATKDPNGNCTGGITRTFTHRTNHFDDFGKSIIYWPSDKYLNIWIVKSIGSLTVYGTVIGYAQFPGGPPETDGVVLGYDFVGTVGSANFLDAGRNATHEIGHYLNLLHLSGCGDADSCADTPPSCTISFGCPTYPQIGCCGPDTEMTDNFVGYSNGTCKDLFTKDQKTRMRATLDVARFNLWQTANLTATGTSDPYVYPVTCPPKADFLPFRKNICAGSTITYTDISTNGTATSWLWSFPGGTPSSSALQSPTIMYSTGGVYPVTLTVTNSEGSTTITRNDVAIAEYNNAVFNVPYSEGFEGSFAPLDWISYNDDGGPGWQRTSRASYTGSYCASVQSHDTVTTTAPGSIKEMVSASIDFRHVTSPALSFRLSYGQQYSANNDSLSVGYSINCGVSWIELKHLNSDEMSSLSGGFQANDFAPTLPQQWTLVTIPLTNVVGKPDVRFRFYFKTDILSNNLYIDDININGVVGIHEEENHGFNFNLNPNPAVESFTVSYMLQQPKTVMINLYDLQGRLIYQVENKHQSQGIYEKRVDANSFHLASGVYLLKMTTEDGVISKKLIYSGD